MPLIRNTQQFYTNSTLADAKAVGCDIVQYKYDGVFKRYDEGGLGSIILFGNVFPFDAWEEFPVRGKMLVWDCLAVDRQDLRGWGYRDRWAMARLQVQRLGTPFQIIANLPIDKAPELWSTMPAWAKGLVYRNSKTRYETELLTVRHYKEMPRALP